jgi:hypothetical protein
MLNTVMISMAMAQPHQKKSTVPWAAMVHLA